MLFGKQLIFQITFSGKLTHFPVFGNDLENSWKTFSSVWYAQKIIFQNIFLENFFIFLFYNLLENFL